MKLNVKRDSKMTVEQNENSRKIDTDIKKEKLSEKIVKLIDGSELKSLCCSLEEWEERIETIPAFKEADSFSEILRVVSNPIRLKILAILLERSWACNCEFEYILKIHQTLISHHLKLLRDSGMVTFKQEGLWKLYRIEERFRPFLEKFRELLFTVPKK